MFPIVQYETITNTLSSGNQTLKPVCCYPDHKKLILCSLGK